MRIQTNASATSLAALSADDFAVCRDIRNWLERAVIGLGLCPFAAHVHKRGRLWMTINRARDESTLLQALELELRTLIDTDLRQYESGLLIHPDVLNDFDDYNQFLGRADRLLEQMQLAGTVQIASFHPRYQFAGTSATDVTNSTNCAPYPLLHLLRESSVSRAIAGGPDASTIIARNAHTLRALGPEGWRQLQCQWSGDRVCRSAQKDSPCPPPE